MLRVILATNHKQLDSYVSENADSLGITITDTVYYKEALQDAVRRNTPEVALISALLPGSIDLLTCLLQLRMADLRIILLVGNAYAPLDPAIQDFISLGIYDILFDPIKVHNIEELLKNPSTFSRIMKFTKLPVRPKVPKSLVDKVKKDISGVAEPTRKAEDELEVAVKEETIKEPAQEQKR